jgi:RNA polymerase sigma-70 factor (ECF subfamily)
VVAHRVGARSHQPRPWLFAVARNLVIDLWRSDVKRPIVVNDEDAMHTMQAKDQFERTVRCLDLAAALRRLEPHHREVLTTVHLQDSSVPDAARRLGIPPGTVKSRTRHALRALRVVLETEKTL